MTDAKSESFVAALDNPAATSTDRAKTASEKAPRGNTEHDEAQQEITLPKVTLATKVSTGMFCTAILSKNNDPENHTPT